MITSLKTSNKPICFVISPIGEAGSETRINADDLLSLVIRPALEIYGFEILRGDHRSDANQIDVDVIRSVQDADLCICDISLPNPNVFYELGRRDETGKNLILLKSRASEELPVDIATRRYIEYDLDSRSGIRDAVIQIRNFVEPMIQQGFEQNQRAATLGDLSQVVQRIERKLDRVTKKLDTGEISVPGGNHYITGDDNASPEETFRLAIIQGNIPLAEQAMDQIKYRKDHLTWLDVFVEQVAALGSEKAGELLIANADEFFDSDLSFKKKVEYFSCLISYAGKTNKEEEVLPLSKTIYERLVAVNEPDENMKSRVHNQMNRLYYGIYANTGDEEWLQLAIKELEIAYSIAKTSFVCYNIAICLNEAGDLEAAAHFISECLEFDLVDKKDDDDHLKLACKIYYKLSDERFDDTLIRLNKLSPTKAQLLMRDLKNS